MAHKKPLVTKPKRVAVVKNGMCKRTFLPALLAIWLQ